jgi:ABC-2 type transport system permease protein
MPDRRPPSSLTVATVVATTELRRRLRDRSLVITGLGAPLVLAVIMGFAFKPSASGALVRIGLVDNAASATGHAIVEAGVRAAALSPEMGLVRFTSPAALSTALADNRVEAGVVVPAGFGEPGPFTPAEMPRATATRNSTLGGPAASVLVDAMVGRLASGRLAAGVAGPVPGQTRSSAILGPEVLSAAARPAVVGFTSEFQRRRLSLIGYFAPSMAIVFLFFGASGVARSILAERQSGTIARLAAAPVRGAAVVAGKLTGLLLVSVVGLFVLWGATTVVFGGNWGQPGPVAAMCLITAVAISALALLVTGFSRDQGQADTATLVIGLVLALLGGNFFPPGSLPTFFADLSLATPNGWALSGFGSLALDGEGWTAVIGPAIALSLFSGACVAISASRLRDLLVPR